MTDHTPEPRTSPAVLQLGGIALSRQALTIIAAAVVVLVVAVLALWPHGGRNGATHYITAAVTRGPLSVGVRATGALAARDEVDVGAEISGRIDAIYVDYNDRVKKGQKLAHLNTDQIEAQLAQVRAGHAQAQATLTQVGQSYPRDVALAKNNAMSKQDLEGAKANLLRARANADYAAAQVKAYQTLLSKATIYAPIDGVVLDRKVNPGQTVTATMQTPVLFTLASDLSQMELHADIPEADIGKVHPGETATFTVDAYPGREFTGTLKSIHSAPKTVHGVVTYPGVLLVANPQGLLKPGMTATAVFSTSRIKNALLVPNAALAFTPDSVQPPPRAPGTGWVWTENNGQLVPHEVKLGASDGSQTQIVGSDLAAGQSVIVGATR